MKAEYYILSPAGNITALVISKTNAEDMKYIGSEIMARHPAVEQVGFADLKSSSPRLIMAGGEFCGNATMSTAALFCKKNGLKCATVPVTVYGAETAFPVEVRETKANKWVCRLSLPMPRSIEQKEFCYDGKKFILPLVNFSGISHIIADDNFDKSVIKGLLQKYSNELSLPALGLMILSSKTEALTPIVYVKKCDTFFYENSCASGSCAVGAYLSENGDKPISVNLKQPGGSLKVTVSGNATTISLEGEIIIQEHFVEEF